MVAKRVEVIVSDPSMTKTKSTAPAHVVIAGRGFIVVVGFVVVVVALVVVGVGLVVVVVGLVVVVVALVVVVVALVVVVVGLVVVVVVGAARYGAIISNVIEQKFVPLRNLTYPCSPQLVPQLFLAIQ